jgi:uncharacterized protein
MRFFRAVKAGVRGALNSAAPGRFRAVGKPVSCSHCGGDTFDSREAQLNTAGMSAVGLDWANPSGTALVCVRCGLIQWFARKPEAIEGEL